MTSVTHGTGTAVPLPWQHGFAQSSFGVFWLNCKTERTALCMVWAVRREQNGKTADGRVFLKAGVCSAARATAHRAVPGQLLSSTRPPPGLGGEWSYRTGLAAG